MNECTEFEMMASGNCQISDLRSLSLILDLFAVCFLNRDQLFPYLACSNKKLIYLKRGSMRWIKLIRYQ